jgi:hypothetical protein
MERLNPRLKINSSDEALNLKSKGNISTPRIVALEHEGIYPDGMYLLDWTKAQDGGNNTIKNLKESLRLMLDKMEELRVNNLYYHPVNKKIESLGIRLGAVVVPDRKSSQVEMYKLTKEQIETALRK